MGYRFRTYLPFYKRNLKVALPIIGSQLCIGIVQLIDTYMVSVLGTVPLAAVAFASSVFAIGNVFSMGILFGLTPLVGPHFVRHEKSECSILLQNAFALAAIGAILICAALFALIGFLPLMGQDPSVVELATPYFVTLILSIVPQMFFLVGKQFLEGLGNTSVAMWTTVVTIIANIVLNFAFIFGRWGFPCWGVFGAGVATLMARCLSPLLIMAVMLCKHEWRAYFEQFRWHHFEWRAFWQLLRVGFPIAGQMLLEVASFALSGLMIGWLGAVALAAHQVMMNVTNLTFMVMVGIASATTIRVSHQIGARNYKEMTMAATASVHLAIAVETITAALLMAGGRVIMSAFSTDEAVITLGAQLCFCAGIFQIFDGLQAVGIGILRGLTDVKVIMRNAFIAYICINLPLGYVLAFICHLGAVGMWIAFIVGLAVAAVLYLARYFKVRRRKFDELQ